jgi:lambda repressor-like predicted transcriptional regulator
MPSRLHCIVLLLLAAFALAPTADALAGPVRPDGDAPAGASANWLPAEDWVMQRWVPFDEPALTARLRMSSAAIAATLDRTGMSLQELARRRGVVVHGLAARLLASRPLPAGSPLRATLLARTSRMLTQSHLAVHMLGHPFHTWTVTRRTETVFAVSSATFDRLYFHRHRSMDEIAAVGGVSTASLERRALAAARRAGRLGRAQGALSAREDRILRARDRQRFGAWAAYRVPVAARAAQRTLETGGELLCRLPAG